MLNLSETTDRTDDQEEHSEMTYKIKKIKVNALFGLINNIVQCQYDVLDDYFQSDVKYKAHVYNWIKKQQNKKNAANGIIDEESK